MFAVSVTCLLDCCVHVCVSCCRGQYCVIDKSCNDGVGASAVAAVPSTPRAPAASLDDTDSSDSEDESLTSPLSFGAATPLRSPSTGAAAGSTTADWFGNATPAVTLASAAVVADGAAADSRDNVGRTPVMVAAAMGNSELLATLLADGRWTVNAVDTDGDTALHHVARNGTVQCGAMLLRRGADVTVRNTSGYTPLGLAAESGRYRPVAQCCRVAWSV